MYKVLFSSYNSQKLLAELIAIFDTEKEARDFCRKRGYYNRVNNCDYYMTTTGCFFIRDKKNKIIWKEN